MGLQELCDLDQGATANFPVGWYVVTKAWAKKRRAGPRPGSLAPSKWICPMSPAGSAVSSDG